MKVFAILVLVFVQSISASAGVPTWQELSSHLFTNGPIVWQAPTNHLPKYFWIYQRQLPRIFSATVISNAIVLSSLQSKGFPRSSTNDFFISENKGSGYMGLIPTVFGIRPGDANIYYSIPNYGTGSGKEIPSDETIIRHAWHCASQLELDPANLVQKSIYTHLCDTDQNGKEATNNICGRGVFLSRQIDGVTFFSADNEGGGAEGFSIEFGSHGQIRSFSLRWSNVERYESQQTASPQEIIQCIKSHKTIVLPNFDERHYFARLRTLANAKKLTITKITPYYGEGVFGKIPTNDVPCKFATPFAELEAVADFGTGSATIRLVSPILSSEVNRLLESKCPYGWNSLATEKFAIRNVVVKD